METRFNKKSNFNDVFGDYSGAYTEDERRERWEKYKKAIGKSQASGWDDQSECENCVHIEIENSWCKYAGLPCTVNPVFGFSMTGMACQGIAFEPKQKVLNLFDS